ncbi:V-type proton ATPase subunit G 1 isoform X2 [Oxyura jamaicensis]|uniref:V-type proton ATPase subunit G 1 isoform X2 n=1 Tax=Oxyura jamaicensis TaxID=8884 RepID=UPI0015A519EB|nr:V-type proton ATPase subunit G 1 isoform X2 [Oxyura jamaicensis]
MASQSQGIQQLLQAEKRAAEKVAEARKRECGTGRAATGRGRCGPRLRPGVVLGGPAEGAPGWRQAARSPRLLSSPTGFFPSRAWLVSGLVQPARPER